MACRLTWGLCPMWRSAEGVLSSLPAGTEKQHQVLRYPEFKISGGTNCKGSACAYVLSTEVVHLPTSLSWGLCPTWRSAEGVTPCAHLPCLPGQKSSTRY